MPLICPPFCLFPVSYAEEERAPWESGAEFFGFSHIFLDFARKRRENSFNIFLPLLLGINQLSHSYKAFNYSNNGWFWKEIVCYKK